MEDEELTLSSSTLAALLEFKREEEQRKADFAKLEEAAQKRLDDSVIAEKGISLFEEDWQLSQFWYSDETADALADGLMQGADSETVVAILSAPSVYAALKRRAKLPTEHIYLFEYDKRFGVLAREHFSLYDYKDPLNVPDALKGKVHRVLVDPPYLQSDCQSKFKQTVDLLLADDKKTVTSDGTLRHRIVVATGERMKDIVKKLYPGLQATDYCPEHGNGLQNEFLCYSTAPCERWKLVQDDL